MLDSFKNRDAHDNDKSPDFPIVDQRSAASKVPRRRSSALRFFASSTTPKFEQTSDPHRKWEAHYLKDLRANRPARPGGSRPLPDRKTTSTPEPYIRAASALSFRPAHSTQQAERYAFDHQERSASALSHRRAQSDMPAANTAVPDDGRSPAGRSPAQQPGAGAALREFSTSTNSTKVPAIIPNVTYRESGMRWMERQEARSLREALEDMDLRDEVNLHAAAQNEASDLVWKHWNAGVTHTNSDHPYRYKQHLEKGAHARSQSQGWRTGSVGIKGSQIPGQRSVSNNSGSSESGNDTSRGSNDTGATSEDAANFNRETHPPKPKKHVLWDSPEKKAYMDLTFPAASSKAQGRRRSSGPRARDGSGGLFRNPEDRIYEEPDDANKRVKPDNSKGSMTTAPLAAKPQNTVSKPHTTSQPFSHSGIDAAEEKRKVYRSEIHRNQPSQSRNPSYMRNTNSSTPPRSGNVGPDVAPVDPPLTKNGIEIRGDDIRAATSMRMKDRSSKLPSPTVVTDRPGRPIVSFDKDWKPQDTSKQTNSQSLRPSGTSARVRFQPHMPEKTASAPIVPTINAPEPPSIHVDEVPPSGPGSIPSISVPDAQIPAISLPDDPATSRPLPEPSSRPRPSPANRPLPHHSSTTPVHTSTPHWSPAQQRATAQCAACALPIAGRIVSAASQRFHPHCFTCYHCAEPLECVAFYPEPDAKRTERLARIEARLVGNCVPEEKPGETAETDGDASLRFYCHLDFHELFSPRCRSCKTPIETEVVIACGGNWHVGHFFCAECGDPFDAATPFVEKNGYAWCVGCHAGRFSGKCKGCRKPVVGEGVRALGGEWHGGCFVCVVCIAPRVGA